MAYLELSPEHYRRLTDLIAGRDDVINTLQRQLLLERAGLTTFQKQLQFDTPPIVFSRQLVAMLQKTDAPEPLAAPYLISLLEEIRQQVSGREEDAAFIESLLAAPRRQGEWITPLDASAGKISVFLSYGRADDEPFVKCLHDDLTTYGFEVWWDRKSMPNRGLTFLQEIRDAINAADRFVLVAGEAAFRSDYVRAEWEYALSQCKPVNVALRKCDYNDLPSELARFDAPDFRDDANYVPKFGTLVRQLTDTVPPLGRLIGVPELPKGYLPRPADMAKLGELVIADVQSPTVISAEKRTTALEGMGGIGKSVLATAFAHDCAVRRAFPDGIIWLTVGQKPSTRNLYQQLGLALGDAIGNYPIDEASCKTSAQKALGDKRCLILLDDVWEVDAGRDFRDLIAGTAARLLITTRNLQINDLLGAKEHRLGLMDEGQAVAMIKGWIGRDDLDLAKVAKQLGYLPLALKLAGARIAKENITAAEYAAKFDRVSRMKTDRKATNRDDNLDVSITLGVEAVFGADDEEKLLYFTFGIFPEDVRLPQETVIRLWQHLRPDVDTFDLEEIITELVDFALIERYEDKTITLHDLLHGYTKEKLGDRYVQTNAELVEAYRCTDGWHTVADDGYFYDHLVNHLYASFNYGEVANLFLSPNWARKRFQANNSRYDGVVHDLEAIWVNHLHPTALERLERSNDFGLFSDCFRYALIRTSINSLAYGNPKLVIAGIKHGIWHSDVASSIAEQIPDAHQRAGLCVASLSELILPVDQVVKLHRLFFDAILNFPNSSMIVEAIKKIAPVLHESYVDEAFQIVQQIRFLADRIEGLAPLLARLSSERRQVVLQEYVNQIAIEKDDLHRGQAIVCIATYLSRDLLEQAIEIIQSLQSHYERSTAIGAIAARLNEVQIRKVYQIAASIQDGKERARAIAALVSILPPDLLGDARSLVENSGEMYERIRALVILSTRLEPVDRNRILDNVFQEIEASNNTVSQSEFPTRFLYEDLPVEYQLRAIKSSFETGTNVDSAWHRAQAFGLVVWRLCKCYDAESVSDIFERSFYELLHMAVVSCNTLAQLIPYLPIYHRGIAVETIRSVIELPVNGNDERERQQAKKDRVYAIAQIMPFLAENERATAFNIAFNLLFSLLEQKDVFDALDSLIPNLNNYELRQIIGKLSEITDYGSRVGALARIARQLSDATRSKVVEKIFSSYLPKMLTETEKFYAIAAVSPLLRGEHLQNCMKVIATFKEEPAKASALANVVLSAIEPPLDEIYAIAQSLADGDARSLLIEALSDDLSSLQISQCLDFVLSSSNVERKTKILSAFSSRLTIGQIRDCREQIQRGTEKLINIVVEAALLPVMGSDAVESFLEDSIKTIISTQPGTAQLGVAWAVASIAPYLDQDSKDKICKFSLQELGAMSGNMSSYPGGNPKTNAYKKLIPCLNSEMQERALADIKTIPHLSGFMGETDNPVIEVLDAIAPSLADELLPVALDVLKQSKTEWSQVRALEKLAARIPETLFERYLQIAEEATSTWMQARIVAALLDRYANPERIIASIRSILLRHLISFQRQTRNELLWSVDVRLFKRPYIADETLDKIVGHIIEICDEWDWSMSS